MSHHKLTIKPTGTVLEVEEGKNLLEVMREKDIYIKSSCGGHATCSDCVIKIVAGEDNLSPSPFPELKLLGNVFHITKERLACQLCITGDVTIDIAKHDLNSDEAKRSTKKPPMKKVAPVKVRKEQDVKDIQNDRAAFRAQKNTKDAAWEKHWEKDPASQNQKNKNQGGLKRPQYFNTDKIDYDKVDYTRPLPEHKRIEKEAAKQDAKSEETDNNKEFKNFRDKK